MTKYKFEADLDKPLDYNNEYHKIKFGKWLNKDFYKMKGLVAKRNIFNYDFSEDSKVLDYGCGIGQITAWIKNKYAFDINKDLYPLLEKKGFVTYNSIKDIPNNFFDEIVLSMCLEHIEDPFKTIKELSIKLRVDGKIRLNLPTASYNKVKNMNISSNGHCFAWGFPDINYLLNRCGFEVLYNKKRYSKGVDRFFFIYKYLGFEIYYIMITLFGYLFKSREATLPDIVVVGRKRK